MVIGTTIFHLDGAAYYSPEFGRGGLSATFSVDVTHLNLTGATSVLITVEHRNSEDTSWGSAGSFAGIATLGPAQLDASDLKEIVRFKYEFTGGTPVAADAVHFLMQAPSWRPY